MSKYTINASGNDASWRDKAISEFGISPGHACHEGDKLESLLSWASTRFEASVLNLSDTLYRYNLRADGQNDVTAYKESLRLGEAWLFRNRSVLESYKSHIKSIHRWDYWLHHDGYADLHDELRAYLPNDEGLCRALQQDVERFIDRKMRQGALHDEDVTRTNCEEFLIEEAVCYILIGRTYEPARVYPAKDIDFFQYLRLPHIPETLRGFEKNLHTRVILNRKPSQFSEQEQVA